ncbi:hypothetical protein MMC19_000230 [Ptychographa xylographoides]|nr:hypothetical protein [Ptychographa xylographoides]
MEAKLLEASDTRDIVRLLQYGYRSGGQLMRMETIKENVKEFVDHYKRRRLPPHPDASLRLISFFKESEQYDAGVDFWSWVINQDNNYVDLRTYGAAIELLALCGQSLEYCEEVYAHALKRFPEHYNEYHLSPGAILEQRRLPTRIPNSSMNFVQGIIKAHLIHGAWKSAYLALDTAFRLHPTQIPSHIFHMFLEERPAHEAYQIFSLLCQSGSLVKSYDVTWLLNDLVSGQAPSSNSVVDVEIALAVLNAIHLYAASGQPCHARHLNILLQSSLNLLPTASADITQSQGDPKLDSMEIVSRVLSIFAKLSVTPEISTYNTIIVATGRLRDEKLLNSALAALSASSLPSTDITFDCLLMAASTISGAKTVESIWNSRDPEVDELKPNNWSALAKATARAGNVDFLKQQLDLYHFPFKNALMLLVKKETARMKASINRQTLIRQSDEPPMNAQGSVPSFVDALDKFHTVLDDKMLLDLKAYPPNELPSWSRDSLVNEEWQSTLYDELSVDPTARALPQEAEKNPEVDGLQFDRAELNTVSPTGFPLDELRYRNWKGINKLLLHAESFEARLEKSVDVAIEVGESTRLVRSTNAIKHHGQRRKLLRTQLSSYFGDIEQMKANAMTQSEWRSKILELRSVEEPPSPLDIDEA